MKLYFIALMPDDDLRNQIKGFKEEVKEKYGAKHALKIPAHITLQIPFKYPEEEEPQLINKLGGFAKGQAPFKVGLSGFGSFPPRVIFVNVVDHLPVVRLHKALQQVMEPLVKINDGRKPLPVHPHVTIASRDLSREAFKKAWPEFKSRDFEASFPVESLFLLKHNGQLWELHREFRF